MSIAESNASLANQQIATVVKQLRDNFNSRITRPIDYRLQQLNALARFLDECEKEIEQALYQDLHKSAIEAYATEISVARAEIDYTRKHLKKWLKPRRVFTSLIAQPGTSRIYAEPLGVVLVIAPWNYPVQLTLVPLIGAIAAGNCVVIKPSEIAPATSKMLATLLPQYLDPNAVRVVEGGVPETTALLDQQFDYIFYTGSGPVGRIVMTAAAKHLTPVTLELGGKSPCIVDKSVDIKKAARRIIWGKFTNAGQTCVAPDYVLAHESVVEALLAEMKIVLREFYGENPKLSPDYGRIVSSQHHQRLMKLIPGGGDIYVGGESDINELYIAPTILHNVTPSAVVMNDEIFGPVLPVITVKHIDEAVQIINAKPKPLALYLFTSDSAVKELVLGHTSSGSACINHAIIQLAVTDLPFGGVGASGMGAYHGKLSFDTFTHYKSVLSKPTWFDPSFMYPPYKRILRKLLGWLV